MGHKGKPQIYFLLQFSISTKTKDFQLIKMKIMTGLNLSAQLRAQLQSWNLPHISS